MDNYMLHSDDCFRLLQVLQVLQVALPVAATRAPGSSNFDDECAGTASSHVCRPIFTPAMTEPGASFAFFALLVAAAALAAAVAGLCLF
jgi:hypothetical protein